MLKGEIIMTKTNAKRKPKIGSIAAVIAVILSAVCVILLIMVSTALTKPKGEEAATPENPLLIVVNNQYHIPEDYSFTLMELSNGEKIDERIYPDLQQMFDDMREQNMKPYVREGYRTADDQKDILLEKIVDYIQEGYFPTKAYRLARNTVAAVGNSEHQLGLAVDINPYSGSANEWNVYGWLEEHSWEYGFILRYPDGKTEITGISYEPWHYRYVGREAAKEIYEQGITLEEYLS